MVNAPAIPDWLARLYPFTPQSFVTPHGARLSFVDEGGSSDEAVLLLHGNPTWSFYFREVIRAISPVMRCVAPDHVGMGLSDRPREYSYTLETRIADVAALVTKLGLRRVHLVVHDWGGAIGFGFAARFPNLIGRIVILNTAAFASNRIPNRIALCRLPVVGAFIVRGLNGFAGPAIRMAMNRRVLTREERRAYLFPYGSWKDRKAVSEFVRDIPLRDTDRSSPTLQKIENALGQFRDRRILIVWGGKDFCFNDMFLARWQQIYPEARTVRIADAGHYVLEDAPESVALIRAHLIAERHA